MEECKLKNIVHICIHIYTFAYPIEGIHGDEMRREGESAGDCVI